ncbi:MAG: ABC transporter permease [Thaumarchaeota archaeon]|nr:ABC transporter permease [Nitrososphaerota archaeon]
MRINKVILIFKKDWREIRRNWQILLPIFVIPFMISVLLPMFILSTPSIISMPASSLAGIENLMKNLPKNIQTEIKEMNIQQALIYIMLQYFIAPFFLVIPIMVSDVIASDSFAGEKERKTIEALLATPISDDELFMGKVLVAFIPAVIATTVSFLLYSVVVDLYSLRLLNGKLILPNLTWLLLVFCLSPTVALTSIGLTVTISTKVKGFREAQQISAGITIPILFMLIFGQVMGIVILGPQMIVFLTISFLVANFFLFGIGISLFGREEILSKLV